MRQDNTAPASNICFGPFELDVCSGELRKGGTRVRLADQPFQILLMLLERAGGVVSREEIRSRLWPDSTVVEFDHSINAAVKRLRHALRESAGKPRYVETLPRRGYRFMGQVETCPAAVRAAVLAYEDLAPPTVPLRGTNIPLLRIAQLSMVAAIAVVMVAWWYVRVSTPARWARQTAIPEVTRLIETANDTAAFSLLYKALQILPRDPALKRLERRICHLAAIRTNPPGARIYLKPYNQPQDSWLFLGESPLENFQLPIGYFRWRITKPAYRTIEASAGFQDSVIEFSLDREGEVAADMVHVPAGTVRVFDLDPVHLEDFWMDTYEVTNKQFKEFADKGGYQNPQYWREEFVKDGRVLSWAGAMREFRDTTGQPGPATWEAGAYPAGNDDFPVDGVSWYEAAAYAVFAKKQLPTLFHWYRATNPGIYSDILSFSNFVGNGPTRVGSRLGIGPFGTYDMAGNVKEWCVNAADHRRYILGGGWNDHHPYYLVPDGRPPFDRSPANGFRCVRYRGGALPEALTRSIPWRTPDRRLEKPVSDDVFHVIEGVYSYDRTELKPVIESIDESPPSWRVERVTFNAAYPHERVIAFLYLPRNAKPPFQTVLYFPPGSAYALRKIDDAEIRSFEFVMKTGRAVLFPISQGTYERRRSIAPGAGSRRGRTIQQTQDFRRSVDYLYTRSDIDHDRLAFYGVSGGADVGVKILALEPRIRAATLAEIGLEAKTSPEIDVMNFAPRIKVPVQILDGRKDILCPEETCEVPFFRLLGTASADKRLVLFNTGHSGGPREYIKATLEWFDRYLGVVKK